MTERAGVAREPRCVAIRDGWFSTLAALAWDLRGSPRTPIPRTWLPGRRQSEAVRA